MPHLWAPYFGPRPKRRKICCKSPTIPTMILLPIPPPPSLLTTSTMAFPPSTTCYSHSDPTKLKEMAKGV
ncbi:hypothetical protein SLEP1_g1561 [Rubroshorea leprosula]|uniref:Uncharacterized protein n=1 Tax=Rubroshorea leprosula TaxID=152421 RepID=A0AAV5HNQ9_9ROSI|nr:hypothetical protein SLEP1_g1561 [Rubroshorea leprosula]